MADLNRENKALTHLANISHEKILNLVLKKKKSFKDFLKK